jgi:hypothetical protein
LPITENFNTNTINVCWNVIDKDLDGNNWYWWEYSSYYGGHKVISSNSYYTSSGALTPDNWIVSHAIDLRSFSSNDNIRVTWKVRGELAGFSHEYYTVYAATNNQTTAFLASPVKRGEYVDEVGGAGVFVTRTIDISALAGNMVYIAFRHHNSTNQYNINIDDVSVTKGAPTGGCVLDSDNDGVCDSVDQCPGLNDALIGTACNDGNPCTIDDTYNANCGCSGTYMDSDNDGVCDAYDQCPGKNDTIDTNNNGIPDGCEDLNTCSQQTANFTSNPLTHSGSGVNTTTLTFPNDSKDVSFTISGIDEKTKGKSNNYYIERVKVTYKDASGVIKTNGTYRGDQVSSATINISGGIQSVTIALDDTYNGVSGTTLSVNLSPVSYCSSTAPCSDSDNDGVCDTNDNCPNTPANVTVDATGCEIIVSSCQESTTNFSGDVLNGYNSTVLNFSNSKDVKFTISGISEKSKGKPGSEYNEIVEVLFNNGSGYQTYGSYNGASISTVSINIPGSVTSVIVTLTDQLGNSGSNLSINFSAVTYCKITTSSSSSSSRLSSQQDSESLSKIDEPIESSFKIFPNPVSQLLYIKTSQLSDSKATISLYNIQGMLVRSTDLNSRYSQTHEVNVKGLSAGMYILRIVSENGNALKTERIIIK